MERFTLDSDGFACTRLSDAPEVWRVELLMEDTFLPSVNAFVVCDGDETLIVDAGTPDDYNDTRLMRALVRLGVDPEHMTFFCTHAHMDHAGLAPELALAGATIVTSEQTLADSRHYSAQRYLDYMADRLVSEGVGAEEARVLADCIWTHTADFDGVGVTCQTVRPGDVLTCGRFGFEVVATPGHTPGHCILWQPEQGMAFLGDSVLYNCSTFIGFLEGADDSLGDQLSSLEMLANMGVKRTFLGHGSPKGDFVERCRANIAHHEKRSARALEGIRENPGSCGFDLVPTLGWRVPPAKWSDTPALTRWFLVSESIAHLDHLVVTGAARREQDDDGIWRYWVA